MACERARLPGPDSHDFRRTAVLNLVRAGVTDRVATMLTGPETRSPFERDDIVSEQDLREAGRKLTGTREGPVASLLPAVTGSDRLHLADFPDEEAHRIPVGLPDFKSGVGL